MVFLHHCLQLVVVVKHEAMLLDFCDRLGMLGRRKRLRPVEVDVVLAEAVIVVEVLIQTVVVLLLSARLLEICGPLDRQQAWWKSRREVKGEVLE